jgi:hypothetical protein
MEEIPSKPPQTARAFLADYWGPKWNEVEEAMLKRGVNLDVDFKLGLWEDAFPEIQEKIYLDASEIQNQIDFVLDWPSEVTIEALDAKFPWLSIETEEELEAANSVAAPFNHELTGLGEAWAAQLDFRIREKWSQGGFIRSPYTTIGMKQESGFYSISTGSRGWSVLLTINETDCPEMGELMKQFNAVIASREEALRQQFRR